mmetsp:Transcript_8167/g.19224  ORF Transcript_8167/g.19224 Transcript_8167/m.19224 type:complete len:132 (+) Transcript_8167:172-567(+)
MEMAPEKEAPKRKAPKRTPKNKAIANKSSRLFSRGVILGPKRSKSNVYPNRTLVKIDGVRTREDTRFYLGKRIAYIYKAKTLKRSSKYRIMWGKVMRPHGNSGVVRTKWRKNIPPKAYGATCRVMLYPSSI